MKKTAFIYIIIAGILWGTSGIFVNLMSPYGFSSLQITVTRGAVACLCLGLFLLVRDRRLFRVRLRHLPLMVAIGVSLFGTSSCYYLSMQMTSISTAVVLMYMAPIYVMIYSALFFGEKFSRLKLVALVCVTAGCCLVSGVVGGMKFDALGILFGILSGVSYGAYNIFTKIAMQKQCHAATTTFYAFVFMSVIALSVSQPADALSFIGRSPQTLVPLALALGVFTYVLPYTLYTLAMKALPAGTVSAMGIVEPMAATVFGVVLYHEEMSIYSLAGIVLILLAVFLLSRTEKHT